MVVVSNSIEAVKHSLERGFDARDPLSLVDILNELQE